MSWGGPGFVIAIIAISTIGWLINNYIRARHNYALEDEWGGKTLPRNAASSDALAEANAALMKRIEGNEQRIAALESIVLDKGYDLGVQIEALRDKVAVSQKVRS
jgi:hypothetical protein